MATIIVAAAEVVLRAPDGALRRSGNSGRTLLTCSIPPSYAHLYTARTRHIPPRTEDIGEASDYPFLSCILFFKPRQNLDFATKTWKEEDPDRLISVQMYLLLQWSFRSGPFLVFSSLLSRYIVCTPAYRRGLM